jgi:hypothetical protein
MYGIWCEVFGGVTGHRASWLKENGKVKTFDTLQAATSEAALHNERTNGNPFRAASFRYTARFWDTDLNWIQPVK